ncbi:MAG: hypothetical protein Q9163_002482 [Psora crenata]
MQELRPFVDNAAFEAFSATSEDVSGSDDVTFDAKRDRASQTGPGNNNDMAAVNPPKAGPGCFGSPKRMLHGEHCDACWKDMDLASDTAIRPLEKDVSHIKPEKEAGCGTIAQSKLPLRTDDTLVDSGYTVDAEEAARHEPEAAITEWQVVLSIEGMTCASCSSAIEHRLSELSFVKQISVTLMTNSARIVFTGQENMDKIVESIEDLGYGCSVERCETTKPTPPPSRIRGFPQRSTTLRVGGMFCKHCPAKIMDTLHLAYGEEVTINKSLTLADPVMKLTYSPDSPTFTIREIVNTIDSVNDAFKTTPYHPPSIEQRSQAMQVHEQRRLLLRLVLSFIVGIPTFLIGVAWMSLVPQDNTLRLYFDEPVWAGTVTRRDWALLILATPVMFFAADVFHVRAVKEIRALWRKGSRVPILRRFYRFGSMNLLLSAGTSVAYFSSVAILVINANATHGTMSQSSTYFDAVVFLTFFILIGRWLEVYSKAKTGSAIAMLGSLKPPEALLITSRATPSPARTEESPMGFKPPTAAMRRHISSAIDADLLEIGDIVLVRHGASPPTDGVAVTGSTKFNESSLTGEAKPVAKNVGDMIYAGAINVGDAIQVKVTEVGGASMLDQIVSIVREGQTKRAPVEHVVDTLTGYFVPVITALAIATWVVWLTLGASGALPRKYLGTSQEGGWAFWSLEFAIAVFVVACPCGIGLAAPTALFVGSGLAAKHGILARGGGAAFQDASNVDAVVFDKTGTLTEGGDLKVTDHEILVTGAEVTVAWTMAKSLEEISSHPIARAIHDFSSCRPMDTSITTDSIVEKPGMGVWGQFKSSQKSYQAALGSETFIHSLTPAPSPTYFTSESLSRWKTQAKSVAILALRHIGDNMDASTSSHWTIAAIFATTDPIRASAIPTLDALRSRNIPVYMLTGDNPTTASAVASMLSIPQDQVFAGILPTEKADKIRWLQDHHAPHHRPYRRPVWPAAAAERLLRLFLQVKPKILTHEDNDNGDGLPKKRKKKAIVAFVGDGINDAPALATASLSISLASAADIAVHSSSFILLNRHHPLASVITLFDLSTRVFRRVKINFIWALFYNLLLIPIAAGCFFRVSGDSGGGWRLGPVWASAAMAASSVSVVLSSLALRCEWTFKKRIEQEGA